MTTQLEKEQVEEQGLLKMDILGLRTLTVIGDCLANIKRSPVSYTHLSDLQRAKDTASYISMAKGLETEILPELREISFGIWEGMTRSEIWKQYPDQIRLWQEDPNKLAVPGAETYPVAQKRLCQTVKKLVATHWGENIVVVSHGGAIRLLLTALLEMELTGIWHFTLESAGINQLVFYPEGRVVLKRLNQIVWE